ncbi:MAG: two-component sensor histidine kinase [Rhodocyclales bacterium]|nr:two-component sensor histidine kinase [Rhodocyclales bacterium]
MSPQPEAFDREPDLKSLLAGLPRARLAAALASLLGEGFRLCDNDGEELLAGAHADSCSGAVPLHHQLDLLGTLAAPQAAPRQLQAAASLLELLLDAGVRLRMAADLHVQAMHEDYRALLAEHAALAESEARYKALAAELEERVRSQVATIEHAQRQLYEAEKMASVGQLAAGVAHEINNPMGFIRSNLGTAQGYLRRLAALGPPVKVGGIDAITGTWARNDLDFVLEDFAALLAESIAGAERVARIVADLKDFSSIDVAEEKAVDLNECLQAVANVARPQLAGRAELVLELAPLPKLTCHAGRLNQVFLGLVQNAAQALGEGGRIRIGSATAPGEIRIAVADNGCGIPAAVLPRIFDPFFTTREVGKGTGLGLTVARDIVAAHGGRIEVDSAPGRGTTVTIILPVKQ